MKLITPVIALLLPFFSQILLFTLLYEGLQAQSGWDALNMQELNNRRRDLTIKGAKIRRVNEYSLDSNGGKRLIEGRQYNSDGYLTSVTQSKHSIPDFTVSAKYTRINKNKYIASLTTDKKAFEDAEANSLLAICKRYLEKSNVKTETFTIESIYTINNDSSVDIITNVDGTKIDSLHDTFFFYRPKEIETDPVQKMDTVRYGDTSLLFSKIKELNNIFVDKRFFVKGIQHPLKTEHARYVGDSLAFISGEVWQFDKLRRLIFYCEYQGPPLKNYVTEKTVYNAKTGEKIVYHDAYPSDGKADKIWKYNRAGQLIESIKYTDSYSNVNLVRVEYLANGFERCEKYYLNGGYKSGKSYEYIVGAH